MTVKQGDFTVAILILLVLVVGIALLAESPGETLDWYEPVQAPKVVETTLPPTTTTTTTLPEMPPAPPVVAEPSFTG